MPKPSEKLTVIDGETLQDMRFQPGKGVFFQSRKSNGQRLVQVFFVSAKGVSAASDATLSGAGFTVPCAPVRPQQARVGSFSAAVGYVSTTRP